MGVVDEDFSDSTAHAGFHFIHHFHRFDDADDGIFFDPVSDFDEMGVVGGGGSVESSDEGRSDKFAGLFLFLMLFGSGSS